jgi:hypothetical protein
VRENLGVAASRTLDYANKTYVDTATAACVQTANNLSDLASESTARINLGLGTAATMTGPAGNIVGDSDTQTLTNKTLTSATLNSPVISTIVNSGTLTLPTSTDTLVARSTTDTLSNKTIGSGGVAFAGATSGSTTLSAATSASGSLTLPSAVDTLTANAATQTLTNKTLTSAIINSATLNSPTVKGYTEQVQALGTVTTSKTIGVLSSGTLVTATLTNGDTCIFTMPSPVAGQSFVLIVHQPGTTGSGEYSFTTPSGSMLWPSAGAPNMTNGVSMIDILSFFSDGTNWYGSYSQGY